MPFHFEDFDQECSTLTVEELQTKWEYYTRQIAGAGTSTGVASLALVPSFGLSAMGVAISAPIIHNARKKREILEKHFKRHNVEPVTRKRDVVGSTTVSATVGILTLGAGFGAADALASWGAEYAIQAVTENSMGIKAALHVAGEGVTTAAEHTYTKHGLDGQ